MDSCAYSTPRIRGSNSIEVPASIAVEVGPRFALRLASIYETALPVIHATLVFVAVLFPAIYVLGAVR